MPTVSILIPARNEVYLEKTIRNVLENATGEIEILVALDGYVPDPPFDVEDNRVIFHHFEEAIGQRAALNFLAKEAKGKYIMKLDAHCAVGPGFDEILAADCEPDWTVIPRMKNLDTTTWEPRFKDDYETAVRGRKLHDYLYLGINKKNELRTLYYPDAIHKKLHFERKDILIDETMSCMGCSFFMEKDRYWELGGSDESHEGGWGQQAVELACKAWLSGGKMMVNKKTWFAHWFRAGDGGFPYPISGNQINRVRAYSKDLWLNDKWPGAKHKFEWLVDKFQPPEPQKLVDVDKELRASFKWRKRNLPWHPLRGNRDDLAKFFGRVGLNRGVEIGTRNGNFAEVLCLANPNLHLTCVDPFLDHIAKHFNGTVEKLSKYNVDIIRKKSMDAVDSFEDESLDFVYIDGDHTFDYAMKDILFWAPKVRRGGVIAAHDFNPDCVDVVCAIEAYTRSHNINPWYVTRERIPTAFWVKR